MTKKFPGLGIGENLKTLSQLIEANQHQSTEIDYLKVVETKQIKHFMSSFSD